MNWAPPSRTKLEHLSERSLSVVIPALNAAAVLPATLAALGAAPAEVVVDGGSTDATVAIAAAQGARGDWLLLHADSRHASGWETVAEAFIAPGTGRADYFRCCLDSELEKQSNLKKNAC